MISDFVGDWEFRRGGLYAEMCKPFGMRAVMKVFLPTGGAVGAAFVFETSRSRFTETDRLAVQRIVSHLAQLRRNAHARRTYPALIDSTAAAGRSWSGSRGANRSFRSDLARHRVAERLGSRLPRLHPRQ